MKLIITTILFLLFNFSLSAQNFEYSGTASLNGIIYSEEESPFWFHSNKRGRIDELTNVSGWANASGAYFLTPNAKIEVGVGGLFQDGYTDKFQLDESYLSFQNNWLEITAGRKQRKELYRGLSASNENILWSLNARPLPGVQIKTTRPVFINGNRGLGFEAALEEYITDDERYVEDTRVHHKSFNLVYRHSSGFEFSAGLQHFVQWVGIHP